MLDHLLVIKGDGTGNETVPEALKVFNAVAEKRKYGPVNIEYAEMGGEVVKKNIQNLSKHGIKDIERWSDAEKRRLGLPQKTEDAMYRAQEKKGAMLFGAVGIPGMPKRVIESGLLYMRKIFNSVNNRPLIINPLLADRSAIMRDKPITIGGLTIISPDESIYSGFVKEGRDKTNPSHSTQKKFTTSSLEKFVKEAFLQAKETKQKILCASKYNVLVSEELLSNIFEKYSKEFEGQVELNNNFSKNGQVIIDNAGMQLALNPQSYENTLVITDAMFGDFLKSIYDVITTEVASKDVRERIKKEGINRIITRDLCHGLYFGPRDTDPEGKWAYDSLEYSRDSIRNLVDVAHRYGSRIGIDTIDTVVVDGIPTFKFMANEVGMYMNEKNLKGDIMDMQTFVKTLLTNPYLFNTLLEENMIGDLGTDLAAALMGSLGIPGSSETNADGFGNYQPISGSGVGNVFGRKVNSGTESNPIGQIYSLAMMLEDHGDIEGANMVYKAIDKVLTYGRTKDIHNEKEGLKLFSTQEMGDAIAFEIIAA